MAWKRVCVMKHFWAAVVWVVVSFSLAGSARAQFTANFQTNIISGTSSNWADFGGYVVGSNTFGDVLLIENGGVLSSDFYGIIGDLIGASNNTAIVTGSGSTWSNGSLLLGYSGAGNNLVISNGGVLSVESGGVLIGELSGASNNTAIVTGSGSVWTNSGGLILGYMGRGNSLVISNGGVVYNPNGSVGYLPGGSNNTVTVTGTGSVWSNGVGLLVGAESTGNRMTISAGGAVHDNTGYVGATVLSSSNVVTITGPGSVWTHDDVGQVGGGLFVIGQQSTANQMTTTNGGAVYSSNIIIGGPATTASSNVVTVTGAGSVWNISPGVGAGNLEVGLSGPGNQLTISDGAAVHSTHGIVGEGGKNDAVTVTGTGSVWDSMVDLTVGSNGKTNTLTIGPGGSVVAINVYINYLAGTVGNRINIEGGSLVSTNVAVGNLTCPASAQLTVDSGMLLVTNAAHNAVLEVLSGTLTLNGGTTIIDKLVVTNSCARFVHAGGTLIVGTYVFDQTKFRSTAVTPSSNGVLLTWMMGPGATNALQAAPGNPSGGYTTNGFIDIFVVTNNSAAGTVTNYLDVGGATNVPARYYRVRLVP